MKVLPVYNIKGGVGKTATAVNLAWLAARDRLRTLVWDLDPQAAASFYLGAEGALRGGAARLVAKRKRLPRAVVPTPWVRLDLLPADLSYRHMDAHLGDHKDPTRRFTRLLDTLREAYDLVLLDCPPSASLLAESVLHAADAVLVPLIPTPLSLRAYEQIARLGAEHGASRPLLPFFSMVDRRRRLHRELILDFLEQHPELLRTYIPYAAEVERMGVARAPVTQFAASSPPARAYQALWRQVRQRIGDVGAPTASSA